MRRDPLTLFALAVAVVLLTVIVGALLSMPEPAPTRVVYVNVGQ